MENEKRLSSREAAEYFKIPMHVFRHRLNVFDIPRHYADNHRLYFYKSELEEWQKNKEKFRKEYISLSEISKKYDIKYAKVVALTKISDFPRFIRIPYARKNKLFNIKDVDKWINEHNFMLNSLCTDIKRFSVFEKENRDKLITLEDEEREFKRINSIKTINAEIVTEGIICVKEAANILNVSREAIYVYMIKYDNFPWCKDKNNRRKVIKSKLKDWKQPIPDIYANKDDYIGIENTAKKFHMSVRNLDNLSQTEDFPHTISIGHVRYFNRKELSTWIKNNKKLVKCKPEDILISNKPGSVTQTRKSKHRANKINDNMLTITKASEYLGITMGRMLYIADKYKDFIDKTCSMYKGKLYVNKNKLDRYVKNNHIVVNRPKSSDGYIPITGLLKFYSINPNRLNSLVSSSTFPEVIKYGSITYVKEEEAKQWMDDHKVVAKKQRKKSKRIYRKNG